MRVLFLTHRLPYAPNRGDRVRSFHLLRHLTSWAEVDLLSLAHDAGEAGEAESLRGTAASVSVVRTSRARNLLISGLSLPGSTPLTHTMLDGPGLGAALAEIVRAHPPAVVVAYCSGMARLAFEPPLANVPLVLDMVDVDSAKWAALSRSAVPPRSWIYAREARLLGRFEATAARRACVTLVTTPKERDALRALEPSARIEVVQNGVDAAALRPPPTPSPDPIVVFCGVLDYEPNVEAAVWLGVSVWPLVRRARPDAQLLLVGAQPTPSVQRLHDADSGIEVVADVPDVRPHLWRAAVSAAPLRTARGVQNKVLEAVAAGLPTVVTPVVMEGLPDEVRRACLEAADPSSFADALLRLLAEAPAARRARAEAADLGALSWERRLAPLRPLVEAAATRQSSP